jgi:PAS domain S-box-containing protein
MATALRASGISVVGAMPWGTHVCLFYETTQDLLDTVVPYFKAGLEHHEFCLWILSAPLTEEEARRALQQAVPDLDRHLAERSIEILPYDAWYLTGGAFDLHSVIQGLQEKLAQAVARGYAGMRASGTPVWGHEQGGWDFRAYEQELDKVIAQQRMLVLCTYPLAASGAADIFDVARHHQVVIARRRGQWEMVETPELKRAKEEIKRLHDELEQRVMERTRQLTTAHKALQKQMAERMRAEEALWKSEVKYRSLFELSHDVIILLDATGTILEMNHRGAHVTGYGQAELRHMNVVHDLVLPEDQARIRAMLADVVKGQAREYDVRWRTKTGSVVHLDGASVPRFAPSGEFLSTLCTLRDITERKRNEAIRQTFAQRLIETQEAERRRIARELHDEIGHALTMMKIALQVVRSATDALPFTRHVQDSLDTVDRALQQVRDLAFDLRPSLLDDLGLVAALRWYIDREAQRAGFRAAFVADLSATRLPAELETACFRIVQAALTNVVRHAQARQVGVELRQRGEEVHLVIRDDGVGFDVSAVGTRHASEAHLGLQGMQERAFILGGQLDMTSAPGHGTEIHAWFPLRASTPPPRRERETP